MLFALISCSSVRVCATTLLPLPPLLLLLPGYEPDEYTVELAKAAGISSVTVTNDRNAVKGADVIYTDVWASMGQKDTLEKKLRDFGPYQVGGDNPFYTCFQFNSFLQDSA